MIKRHGIKYSVKRYATLEKGFTRIPNDIFKVINEYKYDDRDIYIIGGAYVYNECLKLGIVDEILITIVPTVIENADVRVDLSLMQNYRKQEKLKEFIYNEMKVTIWSWKK